MPKNTARGKPLPEEYIIMLHKACRMSIHGRRYHKSPEVAKHVGISAQTLRKILKFGVNKNCSPEVHLKVQNWAKQNWNTYNTVVSGTPARLNRFSSTKALREALKKEAQDNYVHHPHLKP